MGIQVGDNFDHKSKKPLDNRTSYSTLALMKAVVDANIPEGCFAYCAETDKYYKFLSTNTVDADTGKWREYKAYTAGDGIDITDEEISLVPSESTDMDEIVDDLPPITPIDLDEIVDPIPTPAMTPVHYSTDEQVIGTWIDGSTLYQKTFVNLAFPQVVTNDTSVVIEYELLTSAEVCDYSILVSSNNAIGRYKNNHMAYDNSTGVTKMQYNAWLVNRNGTISISIRSTQTGYNTSTATITIQYTKTTS